MHWKVAGIGKCHPLLCAFAALAGYRLFVGCVYFGTPDFPTANSQMRMALFHWWLPKNAAGWALQAPECYHENVTLLAVRHQEFHNAL
jgi:hypothetical protein